ncbi:hypothetical protein B4102_3972 [Heyndrickxia sporothermodurans]|uniref:Uncharacterized protein n=1 Tax=Heyndrickxia sporothermodurans TaxID=46224 RepID=A0A150KKQ3_9BACI|nr:hypothetical protein [Heyndrickxia sporothermodurans]KYC89768.1 hypothetical protein B4102_3972 [Heyndrickxia sporothermodurans]
MKFAKKISIVIMASFLIFTVFSVNNASAQTLDIAKYDTINNDNVVQPYSAAKETTVFVVGLLAGWIIDGILIVNTGIFLIFTYVEYGGKSYYI